jgi:hypothetical protein
MAEMIDILNKLREYQEQGHEVSDAIKSTEMTQTEKPVKEHCHSFKDFLERENLPPVEKMNFNDYAKAAEMYANHKAEMAKAESVKEGGMSDVHIGAQEIVGDYVDDDGNLKMPKVQVIADMDKKKREMDFPKSYEYDVAMGMVRDDFDDGGARKPEIDAESKVQETNSKPDFLDLDKDGNKKEPMKKAAKDKEMKKETVKEAITMSAETPQEAGMLMQILKLAGVQPVDAKMIGAEQPAEMPADETELANSPAGYTNDQKVQSIDDLVNVHSGGLNKQKVQIKKGHPGDNELTAEDLANSLRTQYESFKEQYAKAVTEAKKKD